MKIVMSILALLNGCYMLLDGLFVIIKGKYIGPERPGPWANLFYKFDINVFKLGPLFIIFGIVWLTWIFALWTNQNWTFVFGIIISLLTLWYIPVGTFISLVIFALLFIGRKKAGL